MNIHPRFAAVLKRQQGKQAAECKRLNKLARIKQELESPTYRAELAEKVIKAGVLRHDA